MANEFPLTPRSPSEVAAQLDSPSAREALIVVVPQADRVFRPPLRAAALAAAQERVSTHEAPPLRSAPPDGYSPSTDLGIGITDDEGGALLGQQLFDRLQALLRVCLPPPIPSALARQFFEYARELHGFAIDVSVRHGFRGGGLRIPTYDEIEASFRRATGRASLVATDTEVPWLLPWPPWGGPGGGGGGGGGPKAPAKADLSLRDWIIKFLGAIPGLGEAVAVADLMVEQTFLTLFRKLRNFLLKGQIGKAVNVVIEIIKKMLSKKFRKALVKKLGKKAAFKIIGALTGLATPVIGWTIAALAIVWVLLANL